MRDLVRILAVVTAGFAILIAYKVYMFYLPDRINKHVTALRDRAKSNPADSNALDTLIWLTHSKYSFERTAAIAALGQLGSRAEPSVDVLIQALNTNAFFSGREAAISLGEIGPGARSAIPALIGAVVKYPDEDTGWFAAASLGQIATSSDSNVVAVLRQAAKSTDERMRHSADEALTALQAQ